MKVVKNGEISLESENEFTKVFKYKDIDLFMSKAYDEDTDKHFLVASMPKIPELNVEMIQLPIQYESEGERDESFKNLDLVQAKNFLDNIISQIREQKKAVQE